jgi:hypothetical protein
MGRPQSILFGRDRGMAFFLAFLVLITIFVPMITLPLPGRIALSCLFVLTLIFGALTIVQHRSLLYFVIALAASTLAINVIGEFSPSHGSSVLETTLRLVCLSILVFMTLQLTLRPGAVTAYRVMGGIAGYLLLGFTWTFAYQLVELQAPGAIHFASGVADISSRQPSSVIYFSLVTLTTVGYGDVYPIHPVARSLAVAEALVGQLYIAILISSLVGMALQSKATTVRDKA